MASPNLQLTGGNFQDAEGNVLNLGYLLLALSHDESYSIGPSQIVGGLKFQVNLNSSGSIPVSPATMVYDNSVLTPSGSYYIVRAFKQDGTEAWASPQIWNLSSSPNPLDVGTIVPASPPGAGLGGGGNTLLLETNGTVNTNQSLLNIAAGANITVSNTSGTTTVSSTAAAQVGPRPSFGVWHGWTANGNDTISNVYGCSPIITASSSVAVAATATEPAYIHFTTGTIGGAQAVVQSNEAATSGSVSLTYQQMTLGILACYQTRVQLSQTTTCRVWLGIGGVQGNAGTLNSDTPSSNAFSNNLLMFRYSTNAGDTKWMAYSGTTGASNTVVSTGITPDTNGHIFQITFDGTKVHYWIDGVDVAQISTTIPATNVRMQDTNYIDNVGTTNNVAFNCSYQYWETKV